MPLRRPVGSLVWRPGKDTSVHPVVVLLAALLLAGCGTADEEGSSDPRRNEPGVIVFTGLSGGTGGYYAVRPDGTGLRKLRFDAEDVALSADGRFLVTHEMSFVRDKVWGEDLIFVSRVDGSERRRLPLPDGAVLAPALSPDGSRLALVYTPDPFNGPWDVWTVSVEGKEFEQLSSSGGVEDVEWSPDGKQLVFADRPVDDEGYLDEVADIYVVEADGSNLRRVARGDQPAWSPDGERIAFEDKDLRVSIVDSSGGTPEVVAEDGRAPVWSPDGEQLAFLREISCGHATCTLGLFAVKAGGGPARRVGPTLLFEPFLVTWTTADLAGT
jgi:Tol biopolymer transport system component